jgi:GTP cyclohydrolase I
MRDPRYVYDESEVQMHRLMVTLGFDMNDENLEDTPRRFVAYLKEYMNGDQNPEQILRTGFSNSTEYKGMVVQKNIPFRTICPHHLLPVIGEAHIGYVPEKRVVGLSKLARVVKAVGLEKPRMQEQVTDILADMLQEELQAMGSIVVISAEHMCMAGRGIAVHEVPTITSSIRGVYFDKAEPRAEFFALLAQSHIR